MNDTGFKWMSFVIAVVALVQPWIRGIGRKLFGNIEIYETGAIEIGYGGFGGTVGLHGTLRAKWCDFFVSSSFAKVERLADHSQHHFDWGLFRAVKGTIKGTGDETVELPAGFILHESEPHRFNIQFHDNALQQEVQSVLTKLDTAWREGRGQAIADVRGTKQILAAIEVYNKTSFDEFGSQPICNEIHTALRNLCYWSAGEYKLTLTFSTATPTRTFSREWFFTLTDQDIIMLLVNIYHMMTNTCDQALIPPRFVYPRYASAAQTGRKALTAGQKG
jgi:hypothetical protein